MSGIASAARASRGSVATFCSWTRLSSPRIAPISSASANTRAGTPHVRPRAGLPQQRLDLAQLRDRAPAAAGALEREPVVGDGLDEMRQRAAPPLDPSPYARRLERQLSGGLGRETPGLGEE